MTSYELIFIIGGMMLVGHLMGNLFKRFHLPELAGIVTTGVIIEILLLYVFKKENILHELISSFHIVISVALGLEAFSIGSEMTIEEKTDQPFRLKLLGLQAIFIVIFTLLGMLIMKDVKFALLIGALVGATAPIALLEVTTNFCKDKKLTRGLGRMISFDNIMGIIYFFMIFAIVSQPGNITFIDSIDALFGVLIEIIIGVLVGFILFLVNKYIIRKIMNDKQKDIAYIFFILSILLMAITGSVLLSESSFLDEFYISEFVVTFVAGIVFGNLIGKHDNHHQIHVMHNFIPPLLTVFFVIVGMELDFTMLSTSLGAFLIIYIIVLVAVKMLYGYLVLKRHGLSTNAFDYSPFAVITKSSFEIYLAHLAMISTHNESIFIVVIISIVLFETLEPVVLSRTKLNNLDFTNFK